MPGGARFLGCAGLALLGLAACARVTVAPVPSVAPVPPAVTVGSTETGRASWYGVPHHGRRTASGEVYDMNDLTAAHRTLPLGSRVLVTHLETGDAVEVRINDRGPVSTKRIIDLSQAAARVLGALGPGVIPVRVRVLALPGGSAQAPGVPRYAVQVGSFGNQERAEALRRSLAREGIEAVVAPVTVGSETYYRVRIGSFGDREQAQQAARPLADRGLRPVVVER